MGNIPLCCKNIDIESYIYGPNNVYLVNNWDKENQVIKFRNQVDFKKPIFFKNLVRNSIRIVSIIKRVKSKLAYKGQTPNPTKVFHKDVKFPAQESSIIFVDQNKSISQDITEADVAPLRGLEWYRPKDIFPNGQHYLYKTFDVDDIHQGLLGNCYFLSAISAMAEYPERIDKLFNSKSVQENGCYSINLYIQGKRKEVVVDDLFVCRKNKSWAFAFSRDGEIWVQLLEKAWAKINSSYAMTIAGLPSEALSALTEAPCITYIHRKWDHDKLWKIIKECDEKKYIMCTNSLAGEKEAEENGLVASHAYTLIGVYEIGDQKILKVRNPWGGFEWKGDYCDSSPRWTEEMKLKVNFVNKDDGIFHISWKDFTSFFPYTFCCKYNDGWSYTYKKFEQVPGNAMCISKFTITNPQEVIAGFHQKQERFYNKIPGFKPCYALFILVKYIKEEDRLEFICTKEGTQEKIFLESTEHQKLTSGDYYILSRVIWPYKEAPCSLVYSLYSEEPLEIVPAEIDVLKDNYLEKIFDSFIEKEMKYTNLTTNDNGVSFVCSLNDNNTGFYFIGFKNTNKDDQAVISFHIEKNNKVKLLSKLAKVEQKGKKDFITIVIAPNTRELIMWELESDPWTANIQINNLTCQLVTFVPPDPYLMLVTYEHLGARKAEMVPNAVTYFEMRVPDGILVGLQNVCDNSVVLKVEFKNLVNCTVARPENGRNFKIESYAFDYMRLVQINPDLPIDYQFNYAFKILN